MKTKKKIVIVEENDLYRAAFKNLINGQDHLEVVAETGSGKEALNIIKQFPADLVLMDLRFPEASGLDLLHKLSESADAKILVISILNTEHNIRASFDAGADGYCFKDVGSEELLKAITSVLAGARYAPLPTSGYHQERRIEDRLACDCHILWGYFNRDNLVSARMLNCSRSGCYFETPQHVTKRSTVLIRFEKAETGTQDHSSEFVRLNAMAEVKWCDKRENQYGVGARYHFQV